MKQVQGGKGNTPSAQQSSNKQSPAKKLQNHQVLKMIKLEKLIAKFSKEIGIDKTKLLFILLGDQAPKPLEQRPKSH